MQGRLSSHCRHHAPPMQRIEIRTFRQILERNHELACFCPGCRRWATCNLAELVANGLGDYDPEEIADRSAGNAVQSVSGSYVRRCLALTALAGTGCTG